MSSSLDRPLWQGICLVAGGAIGAGMFALPMVSAGAWIVWSSLGLIGVWAMTYVSCSLLTTVNIALVEQHTDTPTEKISFGSIINSVLGPKWALVNNASIGFILMILMYAYSTASAGIAKSLLAVLDFGEPELSDASLRVAFVCVVALVVWLGTLLVSRLSVLMMLAMGILFVSATSGLVDNISFNHTLIPTSSVSLLTATIPVYVTAFACAGLVPTLVQHFHVNKSKAYKSLLWGTLITLFVYLFWLLVAFGSVEREALIDIAKQGGNITNLVSAMASDTSEASVLFRLTTFSHFAILTSFLGISLSMVHFVRDKLALPASKKNNFTATLVSFVPPALASYFAPYGFIHAIGLAGLFVAFSFFIVPGMLFETAKKTALCSGNSIKSGSVIVFGLLVFVLKISLILNVLPTY